LEYIKKEFDVTPSIIYLLFVIIVTFIILFFSFSKYYELAVANANTIYPGVMFLKQQQQIANSELFKIKSIDGVTDNYINSNYCFSFWVYVNPGQGASSSSYSFKSNVFNYANGKPQVFYMNDGNSYNNVFRVVYSNNFTNATEETVDTINSYDVVLPIQRWHNFVFNYADNKADLYVNGVLNNTFYFDAGNIPLSANDIDSSYFNQMQYASNDISMSAIQAAYDISFAKENIENVVIGDKRGVDGAISNVQFHKNILSSSEIQNTYNLLRYLNPPVVQGRY
jgi:hypothetical protein